MTLAGPQSNESRAGRGVRFDSQREAAASGEIPEGDGGIFHPSVLNQPFRYVTPIKRVASVRLDLTNDICRVRVNLKARERCMPERRADSRLKKFIDDQAAYSRVMPLVHTTNAYSFADICDDDEIVPEECEKFEEDIVYLFYGRPAYRTEKAEFSDLSFNWPIVFIFDPSKIHGIEAVYPFDTGAFFLHLYRRFFSVKSDIKDYKLPGSLEYAAKLVGIFYNDETEYLFGRSRKNVNIPPMNYEAEGIQMMAREPSYTERISEDQITRDERSSSFEVHASDAIDIRDATLAIILPSRYSEVPSVVEALDRWGLAEDKVRYYEVMGFSEGESWIGQVYREVAAVYREFGFIV